MKSLFNHMYNMCNKKNHTPEVKCFIVVSEEISRTAFPINLLLKGEFDKDFLSEKETEGKLSSFFDKKCKIYQTQEGAIRDSAKIWAGTPGSVWILEIGYSSNEVKELATRGLFSQTIIQAAKREDLVDVNKESQPLKNQRFNSSLLKLIKEVDAERNKTPSFT